MKVRNTKSPWAGFTLIELIAVIVILGILAGVAVPRFLNLREKADQAAVDSVAGSLASAFAMNYAACAVGRTSCVDVENCSDGALFIGSMPEGYTIDPASLGADFGDPDECTVWAPDKSHSADFTGVRAFDQSPE